MDVENFANIERAEHTYDTPRNVFMSISNTISSLGMVGRFGVQDGYGKGIQDSLTEVKNLGINIQKLDDYCFYGCNNLKTMSNIDNIKWFGKYCFYGCNNIEKIDIGEISTYTSNITTTTNGKTIVRKTE